MAQPEGTPRRAADLVTELGPQPHPEGGWYRRAYTSPVGWNAPDGESRPSVSLIRYVLLPKEESSWHKLASDEVWLWHGPGVLVMSTAGEGSAPAAPSEILLGGAEEAGRQLQATVAAGTWQSARPLGTRPVVVSCMVTPGFEFSDPDVPERVRVEVDRPECGFRTVRPGRPRGVRPGRRRNRRDDERHPESAQYDDVREAAAIAAIRLLGE